MSEALASLRGTRLRIPSPSIQVKCTGASCRARTRILGTTSSDGARARNDRASDVRLGVSRCLSPSGHQRPARSSFLAFLLGASARRPSAFNLKMTAQ
jgi:hypothetical protein